MHVSCGLPCEDRAARAPPRRAEGSSRSRPGTCTPGAVRAGPRSWRFARVTDPLAAVCWLLPLAVGCWLAAARSRLAALPGRAGSGRVNRLSGRVSRLSGGLNRLSGGLNRLSRLSGRLCDRRAAWAWPCPPCHGRACPGHPRLAVPVETKSWMAGPSPAMTRGAVNPAMTRGAANPAMTRGAVNPAMTRGGSEPGHDTGDSESRHDTVRSEPGHGTVRSEPGHGTAGAGLVVAAARSAPDACSSRPGAPLPPVTPPELGHSESRGSQSGSSGRSGRGTQHARGARRRPKTRRD
jgi:hypothetical protein